MSDGFRALRESALKTSRAIAALQRRADAQLQAANAALEARSRELTRSLSLVEAVLESSPDGVLAVDLDANVTAYNARLVREWAIPHELLARRAAREVVEHIASKLVDPAKLRASVKRTWADADVATADEYTTLDGRTVERLVFPQYLEGVCVGFVVHWRDVTESRRAETARTELAEQLREAQKTETVGVLAAGIAHDFNNILGAILGNLELTKEMLPPEHPAAETLDAIDQAAQRAEKLVQQILAYSRRRAPERRALQLGDVAREIGRLLRASIPTGIALELQIEPGTPDVRADATQMHQVLLNLCSNAVRAIEERQGRGGAGKIVVRVGPKVLSAGELHGPRSALQPGPHARLTVTDDGIGMDALTLERAFRPFFTTRNAGAGTGLGLSMVQSIVAKHAGAVCVTTVPHVGTELIIDLPAMQPEVGVAPPSPAVATARVDGDAGAGALRVLCLDDEPALVAVYGRLLRKRGHTVCSFTNPTEAIAAFLAAPDAFDLLVTDYNMPSASGIDVARAVLAVRPALQVVIVSGYITPELEAEAAAVGVRELVWKPRVGAELEPLCRRVVERR